MPDMNRTQNTIHIIADARERKTNNLSYVRCNKNKDERLLLQMKRFWIDGYSIFPTSLLDTCT